MKNNRPWRQRERMRIDPRIWFTVIIAAALACQSLVPIHPASAASLNISGTWNEIYHCASGWCAGSDFPDTLDLSQAAGSSAVTGTDSVGSTITGSLNGRSLTLHALLGSYTADFKLTVAANGRSWTGSASDSNHTSGTSTATRKLKLVTLSGTLWISDCTDRSCSRAGAEGDTLGVSGKDSDGNAVSTSATSGAGGKWSTKVPAGTFTITPAAGFVPEWKTVDATGSVPGIDFATCGVLGSPASHGRTRAQKSHSRLDVATGEKGCPDGIDWKLQGRTGDVPKIAKKSPLGMLGQEDIYAPFHVNLFLSVDGSRVTHCAAGSVWKWAVTGKPAGAKVLLGPTSPGCQSEMIVTRPGSYKVVAKRFVKGKLRQTITEKVPVRDLLIIAMGDSNGSGEGTPKFWFNQCNRGDASYQYQAAGLLETQSQLHTSVTFVSASCSGARIAHLINTPYEGVRPGNPLPAQIRQIQDALRPPSGESHRKVDAALISVGINDIGFGPILEYCINLARKQGLPCEDVPTRADPSTGPVKSFVQDSESKTTLADLIDKLIKELPSKYDQLSAALSASSLVKPSQVYLTQYPSFSYKNDKGDLCTNKGSGYAHFVRSTWEFLALEGAKLNNAVLAGATAHGWNAVQVPRRLFFNHGYCSDDPWFVGATRAYFNDNINGAFHPTMRGAYVTAVLTLEHLCPLLGDRRFCTHFPEP
jgi:GDSL-like Lipase/Acylhydrolase family